MKRNLEALARSRPFDLLIIGGGIYGAWAALDAARRGLEVALVEGRDWAAGTSSASSKLVHGGLRYLENWRFGLVRKSLLERQRLLRLAPHQVRPLRFVIPLYTGDRVGRRKLAAGLRLYDLLAGGRRELPPHRALGRGAVLQQAPWLATEGLIGGFDYGDGVMDDARLVMEVVAAGVDAGVVAVNHVPAERLLIHEGEVHGAIVRDGAAGGGPADPSSAEAIEVRASVVVNCAGPWAPGLLPDSARRRPLVRYNKGIHLVMPSLGSDCAMLVMARADGRPFFMIPWYGRTLLGTTDTVHRGHPDDARVEPEDVRYLLHEAERVLGDRRWTQDQVLGSFAGLRTLRNHAAATPGAISREWSLLTPLPRLLMPVGGKYTAARADAERIVDRVVALLGRGLTRGMTSRAPLPFAPTGEPGPWLAACIRDGVAAGLDAAVAEAAARRFGTRVAEIHRLAVGTPALATRIHRDLPFCLAEIVHGARHEMALTLQDLLRRRIPLLLLARPDETVLAQAAAVAGQELGWDEARRRVELGSVLLSAGA
jgi:glycerol-3-phosphate dehydrogenase